MASNKTTLSNYMTSQADYYRYVLGFLGGPGLKLGVKCLFLHRVCPLSF